MYQGRNAPDSRATCCHQESARPVSNATSTARAARWRPPPGKRGSSRPAQRASSPPSRASDHVRNCSRRSASNGGSRNSPSAHDNRASTVGRSEEHTSELQSQTNFVCRLLLEKKNIITPGLETQSN